MNATVRTGETGRGPGGGAAARAVPGGGPGGRPAAASKAPPRPWPATA
jgi:hypothetical protein